MTLRLKIMAWNSQQYILHKTSIGVKVIMQGQLFQRCTHLLYGGALSLGGNVNTRRISKPEMGSSFHMKNQWNILVIGNYYANYQNYQNLMLLTAWDTKRTLMHQFLFKFRPERTGFNMYPEYRRLQFKIKRVLLIKHYVYTLQSL